MNKVLYWFRQDLRISDNPALELAAGLGRVYPVYILDDRDAEKAEGGSCVMGGAAKVWLANSLRKLDSSLDHQLKYYSGSAENILTTLVSELEITHVVWTRCYEPWRILRDKRIKNALIEKGIEVISENGSLLWEPWTITKQDGSPYKVFTPYFKKGCLNAVPPRRPSDTHLQVQYLSVEKTQSLLTSSLGDLDLVPDMAWVDDIKRGWEFGEQAAQKRLEEFVSERIGDYKEGRDFPGAEKISRLSPHLHFGEISPHQVWYAANEYRGKVDDDQLSHFLSELGWREFSYYLLYHWPQITHREFNGKFGEFPWNQNSIHLVAWQQGKTGFPIIDAGMRELWQTGYMHNRVRMIVASFLIKNLLIDWRVGMAWFWDCLFDADLASNSASWQWVAGSGADAAPYFRIFNPVLQSEKFDPNGDYILKYCPELAILASHQSLRKFLHKPFEAKPELLEGIGFALGEDYPKPIVCLKETRERALAAYHDLPKQAV